VALSAFDSFCRGAEHGRFPQLADRHDLWPLLVVLTARKANRLVRHERRQKRGGGKVHDEAILDTDTAAEGPALAQLIGREPTPEFAAQVAEEFQRLLDRLGDEELRTIALWKLEGYTNEEIAAKLGCVARTVERKLRVIRGLLDQENAP
jgi:DNA-directed RNA polymerase specialized sigma24 family protein